MTDGIWSA